MHILWWFVRALFLVSERADSVIPALEGRGGGPVVGARAEQSRMRVAGGGNRSECRHLCWRLSLAFLGSPFVQGLFKALATHLWQESDRQGRASERWVHTMLEALVLRVVKKGALALDEPPRTTLQVSSWTPLAPLS